MTATSNAAVGGMRPWFVRNCVSSLARLSRAGTRRLVWASAVAAALAGLLAVPAVAQADTPVGNQTYVITQADTDGYAVDVRGASTVDGTPITSYPVTNGPNQSWIFRPSAKYPGWYHLVDANSGKCMDVTGASTAAGAPVQLYTCDPNYPDQPNQLWQPLRITAPTYPTSDVNGGWVLLSKNTTTALTRAPDHSMQVRPGDLASGLPGQVFEFKPPGADYYWQTTSSTGIPPGRSASLTVSCRSANSTFGTVHFDNGSTQGAEGTPGRSAWAPAPSSAQSLASPTHL
jgi:hypothetical protein